MQDPTTRKNKGSNSKLLAYSGMAGAFLALARDADGQIIYTDVIPDDVIVLATHSFDLDGDGLADVAFRHHQVFTPFAELSTMPGAAFIGILSATVSGSVYVRPSVLPNGAIVGPASPDWHVPSSSNYARMAPGNWQGQSGFVGYRFLGGDGGTHYAWIELEVGSTIPSVIVKGYAYEATPNTAISTGDISTTIPEMTRDQHFFEVFPNPATDHATIRLATAEAGTYEIRILNGVGQVLSTQRITSGAGSGELQLDLGALAPGTYFVELRNGERITYRKVTKIAP